MREQVGVHADHMVPLRHSGPERMTVALGAVALVPFGSGSNCACFLRTGGLDGAPELRLDGPRFARAGRLVCVMMSAPAGHGEWGGNALTRTLVASAGGRCVRGKTAIPQNSTHSRFGALE